MLTREQLTANINAMETQGASQEEIQGYLDNLPKPSSAPVDTPAKPQLAPASVDIGNIWKGTKDVIKATPEIAGNIWDTFTTKQGLSDVWNVTKNAGVSSVEDVLANYNDLFWGGAQKGLKAIGLDTISEWAGNDKAMSKAEAKKSSDEIKKFFYGEGDVKGYSDPNDQRGFLEKLQAPDGEKEVAKIVGSQVPTFLALMGITVLAKGTNIPAIPATLSASFAMNTGDAYQQGKDYVESTGQPMTPELDAQIQKASVLSGVMTAPLDAFGMDRILKPSQFINFKSKLAGSIVNGILDTGVDTVAEGGTEALQEVFQNAWAKTYNANQDLFSGVGEAFFGGGLFGGGSSALINSSGMLRTGIVERLKQGEDVSTIKADVIKGAKEAGSPITEAKIDEAITDAQKVYDGVVTDITDKLDSGKTVQEVALDVSQHTDVDNAIAFVTKIDENRSASTVQDTQKELLALSDKVDASVLKKTASDLQNDFERVQSHIDEQVKSIKDEVDALKEKVNNAPDRSTEKKRLKATLENKRGELRDAEASFYDKVTNNSTQFRSFITDYAQGLGVSNTKAKEIANTISDIVTGDVGNTKTIEELVAEQVGTPKNEQISPVPTKNRSKEAKNDKKVSKVEEHTTLDKAHALFGHAGDNADGTPVDNKAIVATIPKDIQEAFLKKYKKAEGITMGEIEADLQNMLDGKVDVKPVTQKEKVKKAVEKKGKATIKEIADDTGILEPNVRRILGMGAKEGEFKRVESGVYTITTPDGKEVAVVIPTDAVETLPKLAKIEDKMNVEDPMSKAFHLGKGGFAKGNNVTKARAENERNITKTIKEAKEHVAVVKELEDITIAEKNYKKLTDQYKEALTLQQNKETSKGIKLSEGDLRELKKMIRDYEVRMGRLERSNGFVRPEVTFAKDTNVPTKEDRNTTILERNNLTVTSTREEFNDAIDKEQTRLTEKYGTVMPEQSSLSKDDHNDLPDLEDLRNKLAPRVPFIKEEDPIKRNTAIVVKLQEGTATLEEYNAGYKDFIENKEAIREILTTQKKDELMKRVGRFSYSIRPSSSKNDMVNSILDTMESRFALGKNIVYSFGGRGSSGAVSDLVEKMTQEDLTKYAEKVKENTKAYAESIQALKKALTNPETLDEFKTYLQANNGDTTKLTPEQLKNYDELLALAGKAKREKDIENKGYVRGVDAGTDLTVTESKNTKTGEDIFVVKLSDRVEKETYQALNTSAKKLGGYYSRFSKGFLFKDRASAEQFVQVGNGKEVKTDAPVIHAENKKNATAQKLADMAISMREKANEELNRERLTNTSRRAGMASGAEESARVDLAMADTMENLSKAIESREAVLLDGITARTQIEALESVLRRAHYENSRKIEGYGKQEEFRKQAPTEEDIPFVSKFPDPVGMVGLREAVQKGLKTSGSIKLAKTIQKAIEKLPADTNVFPASFKGMETIAELADNLNLDSYSSLRHEVATFKRLKAMGVTGTAELRAILREFLTYRGTKQEADKAVELERKLIGAKVGIDFFPTPKTTAERMVSDAGVEAGMKVLEPSAGNGNIAEVMRDKGANVDVLEISGELRNVLEAKGFNVVGNNFMDYTEGGYDAIVMNPPFSNNQDIDHIQHAYTLLKEGGTLTAIAGEGAFFRGTSKAQGFQSWLEEVNADVEKLDENTFMDKKLMVNTGANARLITIKKEKTDPTADFTTEELAKGREQAKETVSFYLGSAEAGYRIFVPESNSMDLKVVGVPSSFPQHLPDNMRSRKTFDRLMPFWEKQERPSAKTPMLQELYDIFQKDVEEDTLKYAKMNKENEEKAKSNPTDNIPFKTKAEDTLAIDFKQRKYKFNVEYGVKEAKAYIEDVQKRLGISFDVEWVDEVVSRYSLDYFTRVKTPIEYAEGLMEDNTIAIKKNMDAYTAEHEIGHLTLANIDKISAFKDKGITRDKLMRAMADKEGVVWTEKNDLKIEEQIMYDFEKYAHERTYGKEPTPQKGIIQQFFDTLYNIISKFIKANVESNGDILKDYYDVLYEGYSTSNEITYLENNGIVKSFIQDGVLDAENIGRHKGGDVTKFKLSEETDAYFQKKKKEFNDLVDKKNKLAEIVDTRKGEIEGAINAKKEIAQIVQEANPIIKEASRYTTKKKPPVGSLTKKGEEFVDSLEFVNRAEAEKEIKDYLLAKTKLVETTNQLRKISKDISTAKKEGKVTREALRDVARRLKLRKRLLEQKDFYMSLGKGQGKKEAFSMIQKRGRVIRGTQEMFGISDAKAKELIGSKRINQMSEKQFNEFLTWFTNNAQLQSAMQDARDEVTAILFEKQFQKEDNLRKSLGLPPLNQMTEAQATMYAGILYTYQFGDVFLTKREMETSARTKYEEIKTERELIDKIEEVAGIPRGELKTIDATSSDRYKNWFQLSKKNLFYDWLVGRNMIAKTKEIQQVYMFRRELDTLTRNARKSRSSEKSLKDNIWDFVAPTDAEVFEALNTGDFSKLTTEEKLLADFLTMMFRTKYDNLTKNFKDFKGRENYVTHMSRDFFETLKDTGSLKEAYDIFRKEQKDTENAVEILAGQTGEILAFDKFLPYMLKRSDKIIPSKNVSRIALTYFTATTRKELLDEFIPEAMLTLHGYKVLNGQTAKGLDLKPFLETFTKEYLNNAKGRRIDFITRQGSDWDTGLMAFTSWISFKYIGGNPILAFMNLFGDLVALSAGTTNAQKVQSVVRSFKSNNVDEAIRGLIGHNPLVDLLNTQTGLFQRILPVWFSMMSSTSYLANKFTVKGLLTEEEFKTGIITDERIQEMARQINKFKLTDSYGRSLVGSTTAGKASLQFKTWAVPFLITGIEHIKSFATVLKEKGFNPETKKDAIELARIVIIGGLMYVAVQAISNAFGGDDDKDNYLWKQIENNLNTIYGILSMPFDKANLAPVVIGEINAMQDLLLQLATQEAYAKPTGKGQYAGDLKALQTLKKIIVPAGATRVFNIKPDERTPSQVLIDESLKNGEFDAENIAMMTSMNWGDKTPEQRESTINEITRTHTVLQKYPNSKVASIILGEKNNKDRVAKLIQYSEKVGIDATYEEMKTMMKDKELYSNQKKYTGAFISAELFRDFQLARKKLQTNK